MIRDFFFILWRSLVTCPSWSGEYRGSNPLHETLIKRFFIIYSVKEIITCCIRLKVRTSGFQPENEGALPSYSTKKISIMNIKNKFSKQ